MRSLRLLIVLLLGGLSTFPGVAASQGAPELPNALAPDASAPLEGTTWRLRGFVRRGTERRPGPEVAAAIQLRRGRLTGSGGCTAIQGGYATMGRAIEVELARPRRQSCGGQRVVVQESLREGLAAAVSFQLVTGASSHETQLLLKDADEAVVLRFEVDDAAPLTPGEWRLEAVTTSGERSVADPTQPAVLAFQPSRSSNRLRSSSGDIVGSTGCNGVVGRYVRQAEVISFDGLEVTDAPCSPPLAAQETAILDVLDSSPLSVRLPPDRLVLTATDSGDQLEFVSAVPLESTWLLERVSGSPRPQDTVTLHLQVGRISGEGPCGPYGGDYDTDGVFISFSALAGTDVSGCDERAAQRRLFDALRRTVLLDRSRGDLRLLDASGRETARFSRSGGP